MDALLALLAFALVLSPFVGIVLGLVQRTRLKALEDEVRELRKRLDGEPGQAPSEVVAPVPARAEPALTEAPAPEPAPAPPKRDTAALESFLGGRVLLVVGVVAVLFAVGFFLKVAFERGWFPPEARVASSILVGVAALIGGDRLRARGLANYGHAIMGGGLGALFLAVFYAAAGHELIAREVGFAATAAVTWMGATLALRRDAPLLAWLGFLGAFLAPALLGRDEDALESLTAWLAFANVGVAWVLVRRAWPGLDALAVLSTCSYFALWLVRWGDDDRRVVGGLCLAALTVAMLVVCHGPAIVARRAPTSWNLVVALFASAFAAMAGHELLADSHRAALGLGLLVLGALHAVSAVLVARRAPDAAQRTHGEVLACYALAAVGTAVPYLFDGEGVSIAWAATGAAAIAGGARRDAKWFAQLGAAALVLSIGHVLVEVRAQAAPQPPFAGAAFWSSLIPAAAAALAAWAVSSWRPGWSGSAVALRVVGGLVGAFAVAVETQRVVVDMGPPSPTDALQAGQGAAAAAAASFAAVVALCGRRLGGRAGPAAGAAAAVALLWLGMSVAVGPRWNVEPFVNRHVATGLAALLGLGVVAATSGGVQRLLVGVGVLAAWLALASVELYEWGEVAAATDLSREALRFRAQVWISVVWGITGTLPVVAGFVWNREALRWTGLGVLAATVAKVFLFDMSRLDTVSRIGSFLALGLLLVGASFLYQRVRVRA